MNIFFLCLHQLLDLRVDTHSGGTDESIRQNVNFKSANAWTLVFAIFIASVGLNVNSTTAIIGVMLISPLMGPIVGSGHALGINDFFLLKQSGKNLMYLNTLRLSELEIELKALRENQLMVQNILTKAQAFLPTLTSLQIHKESAEMIWKKNPKANLNKALEDFVCLRIKREQHFLHAVLI